MESTPPPGPYRVKLERGGCKALMPWTLVEEFFAASLSLNNIKHAIRTHYSITEIKEARSIHYLYLGSLIDPK